MMTEPITIIADPVQEKELDIIRYHEKVTKDFPPEIKIHVRYSILEYKPNKFCLKVNIIKDIGYSPSIKVFCFDEIQYISLTKSGTFTNIRIDFITYPSYTTKYDVNYMDEDADKLYQFIMDNVIYRN